MPQFLAQLLLYSKKISTQLLIHQTVPEYESTFTFSRLILINNIYAIQFMIFINHYVSVIYKIIKYYLNIFNI